MNNYIFKCDNVSKAFNQGGNKIFVLKNLNFCLETSSTVGVLGPSGSGKTTFLHILSGLDFPSSGDVFFRNENLNAIDENRKAIIRNKEIGFVYQFHHLLPELTAIENISLPILISGADREKAFKKSFELLTKVNLDNRIDHKPGEMSGGERQRVAIARSLANEPSCLIMDEPTGDLDLHNAESVFEIILDLVENFELSLIVATHDSSIIKKLDMSFDL